MDEASGEVRSWRCAISQGRGRFREVCRLRFIVVLLAVALLPGVLSACGDSRTRSVRLGMYVSQLPRVGLALEQSKRLFSRID